MNDVPSIRINEAVFSSELYFAKSLMEISHSIKPGFDSYVTVSVDESPFAIEPNPGQSTVKRPNKFESQGRDGLSRNIEEPPEARIGNQPRPKIIALTANAMQGDKELCLAAGMDDYVAKPVKLTEMSAAIRRQFQ